MALRRCGYNTSRSIRLWRLHERARFPTTTGIQHFYDGQGSRRQGHEPDSFFYDKTVKLIAEQPASRHCSPSILLAANHFPWRTQYRPDCCRPGARPATSRWSTNICGGRR